MIDTNGERGAIADQAASEATSGRKEDISDLEAEITANAPVAELSPKIPEFKTPEYTFQEILEMAGFSEGEHYICVDGKHWYSEGTAGWRDSDHGWRNGEEPVASLARKAEDGKWMIGTTGFVDPFKSHTIGRRGRQAHADSVLTQMAGKEKTKLIEAKLKAEQEQAELDNGSSLQKFFIAFSRNPVFSCLPSDFQKELGDISYSKHLPRFMQNKERLLTEWNKATALYNRQENEKDILVNFGGKFREMGSTDNAQYWVVQADGTTREPDKIEYLRGNSGNKEWRVIGPSELALRWSKGTTAANHNFVIDKPPEGGYTEKQLSTVSDIQRQIGNKFKGIRGMSGKTSPSIGNGWGICQEDDSSSTPDIEPVSMTNPTPERSPNMKQPDQKEPSEPFINPFADAFSKLAVEPESIPPTKSKQEKPNEPRKIAEKTAVANAQDAPEVKLTIGEADPEVKVRLRQAVEDIRSSTELLRQFNPRPKNKKADDSKELNNIWVASGEMLSNLQAIDSLLSVDDMEVDVLEGKIQGVRTSVEKLHKRLGKINRAFSAWQQTPEVVNANDDAQEYISEGLATQEQIVDAARKWLVDNKNSLKDEDVDWEKVVEEVMSEL